MLYEITMRGTYMGQQTINRWNYVSTGTPASVLGSFGLASAFGVIGDAGALPAGTLFAAVRDLVSAAWTCQGVEVRAVSNYAPTDFYERPFITTVGGSVGSDPSSPVLAYGFRSSRVRLDIGRATKRFAGVAEDYVTAGGALIEIALTKCSTLATRMTSVLSYDDEGNVISFSPCVVQKLRQVDTEGKVSYVYYPTLAAQLEHVGLGIVWGAYPQVRSQVSRQYARGS